MSIFRIGPAFSGNAPSILPDKSKKSTKYNQEHPTLSASPINFFNAPVTKPIYLNNTSINPRVFPEQFVMKYANQKFIKDSMNANPKIGQILKQEGLPPVVETGNVTNIIHSHLIPTMIYAKDIMANSGESFSQTDYQDMAKAALLHDIGKTLIPKEILNKKEKLTPKEYEIVKLHNDLGYEILKTAGLNNRVLELVQNHHGYGNIYPKSSMTQILTVADIYSALKEDRPYKKPMSDSQAFEILQQGAQAGDFNMNYVNSLIKSRRTTLSTA